MAKVTAPQPISETDDSFYLPANRREVIKVGVLGAVVGLLTPLLGWLVERFFIEPVFCQSADSFGVCASGGLTAYYAATVILGIIAIVLLVNWQIFRPLLIAVFAAAALWGFKKYTGELSVQSGVEYYLFSMVLFGLAYILFYWAMRLKAFMLSLIVSIILIALIRWALAV